MNVVSLVVAVVAILASAVGVFYASRSADSARRSAVAADRSVTTAEESLSIERRRRHEERRPKLSGEVSSPDGGHSYQLKVTLDADSCPLTALEVVMRPGQGVSFQSGFSGVVPVGDLTTVPLRAFACNKTNEPSGLQPGQAVTWWTEVAREHEDRILLDVTCHAEGKGEGEDQWTVVVEAPVEPRLLDTIR